MTFPQRVACLVSAIPAGKVLNYGEVAYLLGQPRNARTVGYALSALPAGTSVPWYRVVGKNGRYGKVSLREFDYGHHEQIARLQAEGIPFDEQGQFVLEDFLWKPTPEEVALTLAQD